MRQAVGLVWASARGWTILQMLTIVVGGGLPVAMLLLTKRFVDAAGAYLVQPAGLRDPGALLLLAPWLGVVVVAGWLIRALSSVVSAAQSEAVSDHVQDAMQRKSIEVDLEFYESPSYYDKMRMAQAEAGSRPTSIVRNLVQLGSGGIVLVSVAGVVGYAQGILLPVLLVAALPGALARIWNARRWNRWRIEQSEPERFSHYLNMLMTAMPFAKEIRLNANGAELRQQYQHLRRNLRHKRLRMLRNRAGVEMAADGLSAGAVAIGLGLIYLRMRGGEMTLGDLALLYGGLQKGKSAFGGVLGSLAALYEDSLFISHFYEFLALPARVRSPEITVPLPDPIREGIRLEHVSFRYPGTERDVLHDISLDIRAGEHVALVGENGSGKTTLVKLLCRLYDPTEGRILIDGTDIREFAVEDLRAAFSGLFQDFARYHMTAGENVRMGDVSVPHGDPRIAEAARRAGAAGIIDGLPKGYDTRLGRMFKDGAELSEGQWQRVALARALLRPAPFVLLDEPTSALDAKAERRLIEAMLDLFAGKTAIVVSHRFATVQAADRIVVLFDGRIEESGTHQELLARDGLYADLFLTATQGMPG